MFWTHSGFRAGVFRVSLLDVVVALLACGLFLLGIGRSCGMLPPLLDFFSYPIIPKTPVFELRHGIDD